MGKAVSRSKVKSKENQGDSCDHKSQESLAPAREAIRATRDVARLPWFSLLFALLLLTALPVSSHPYVRFQGCSALFNRVQRTPLLPAIPLVCEVVYLVFEFVFIFISDPLISIDNIQESLACCEKPFECRVCFLLGRFLRFDWYFDSFAQNFVC